MLCEHVWPAEHAAIDFWAKAYGYGRSTRENEPVTVRGTPGRIPVNRNGAMSCEGSCSLPSG